MLQKTQMISQIESSATTSTFSNMSCLEQAKYVESQLDATTALLNNTTKQIENNPLTATPRRNLGSQNIGLLGTPTARPFNWIVQQANTEVKLLRQKAENLQWFIPLEDNHRQNDDLDNLLFDDKENHNIINEEQSDLTKVLDIDNIYFFFFIIIF